MKFAREFKAALEEDGYPEAWLKSALPYGALKKCLKDVRAELDALGLDPETLRQLLASHLAKYDLDVSESQLRRHFTVLLAVEDDVVVGASLSPACKAFLRRLAARRDSVSSIGSGSSDEDTDLVVVPTHESYTTDREDSPDLSPDSPPKNVETIEVSLKFDEEFLRTIYDDITLLDELQRTESDTMTKEAVALGQEVAHVTKPPPRFSRKKNDLSQWRELFELYLEAQIFFSTHERDRGAHDSANALRQLQWFQSEANRRGLPESFNLPSSRAAYNRFLVLNKQLFLNLRFQERNKTALGKILKKFDKRTSLGVSGTFATVVRGRRNFMVESVAKSVCAQISDQVVAVVPRLEDYMCPVCLSLAWLPVRLDCRHLFCVRCVIKMQREQKAQCPLCREEVVMKADLDNLDAKLEKYLKLYFREEAKEKQRANEMERGVELFGESYKPGACAVM